MAEDASSPAGILIDTAVTYTSISGAAPITLPTGWSGLDTLAVTVSVGGKTLAQGNVPLNASAHELPFSLGGLQPQMGAYNVSCTASYSASAGSGAPQHSAAMPAFRAPALPAWADLFPVRRRSAGTQVFSATTSLSYLPNPTNGSVTKMDLRTGALMAKPANGSDGAYAPVFAIGFYSAYDGYLASNFSVLDELKAQGFTVVRAFSLYEKQVPDWQQVHPIPPFDDAETFEKMLDHMQDVGLYLMYDMR